MPRVDRLRGAFCLNAPSVFCSKKHILYFVYDKKQYLCDKIKTLKLAFFFIKQYHYEQSNQ